MVKKVVFILVVLSFIFPAVSFAAIENVKVSGSLTVNAANRANFGFGSGNDDINGIASTALVDLNMDISENVEALLTIGEDRAWGIAEKSYTKGLITLKKMFDLPITLKIGNQPLNFGSGLLIGDINTNQSDATTNPYYQAFLPDLSQRTTFDSILAVIDLSPLTVNLGFIKDSEGDTAATAASRDDDRNTYFLYSTYDFGNKNMLDVYWVMKDTQKSRSARADVNNFGGRWVSLPSDKLVLWAEFCYQNGKSTVRSDKNSRSDFAASAGFNYTFLGTKWTPSLGLDYGYLSDNWDPMYEATSAARIANAILPATDAQVIGATLSLVPREDLNIKLRYINLNLIRPIAAFGNIYNPSYQVDSGKKGLGNEIDLTLTYDYTEDVQFSLYQDCYMPGKFFGEANQETAYQNLATVKVSF